LPEPSGDPELKEFVAQFPAQPTISMTTVPVTRECWNPKEAVAVTHGSQMTFTGNRASLSIYLSLSLVSLR